jgi:predicted transcriptional regulator
MSETSSISYDEFIKYREANTTPLAEVQEYIKSLGNHKHTKNSQWKRPEKNNNWLAQMKFNQDADEKLYSQFRNLLNKLSDSNFNQLAQDITNLQIQKKYHLERLVDHIFQKAISEEKFNELYAKLSKDLSLYYIDEKEVQQVGDDDNSDAPVKITKIHFREILINKCQQMFTLAISLEKEVDGESGNSIFKYREQVVGCMSFLGQLYQQDLLTGKIIYSCFTHLFTKAKLNRAYIIDSLCTLMRVVGKKFIQKSPKEGRECLEKFNNMQNEVGNVRDKFAIMDIMDIAKKEKW